MRKVEPMHFLQAVMNLCHSSCCHITIWLWPLTWKCCPFLNKWKVVDMVVQRCYNICTVYFYLMTCPSAPIFKGARKTHFSATFISWREETWFITLLHIPTLISSLVALAFLAKCFSSITKPATKYPGQKIRAFSFLALQRHHFKHTDIFANSFGLLLRL